MTHRICSLVLTFFFTTLTLFAQDVDSKLPITVSYLGHVAVQPGLAIGSQFNLGAPTSNGDKNSYLFLAPKLGFYSRTNDNLNLLVSLDFGYRMDGKKGKSYQAFGIQTAYQSQWQLISQQVSLGDGSKADIGEQSNFFLAMAKYEHGRKIGELTELFSSYSVGSRLPNVRNGTLAIFWELGLRCYL